MKDYEKLAKKVEENFSEPQYLSQRIKYVEDKESADVCVSARHTIGDYLLVGIIALYHSINGKSGDILVFNDTPELEIIGVAESWNKPFRQVAIDTTTYFQAHKAIEEIYQKLYNVKMTLSEMIA